MRVVILSLALYFISSCAGHGYLSRPPARNFMGEAISNGASTRCPYGAGNCGPTPPNNYDKMSLAAGGPGRTYATCSYGSAGCVPRAGMCGDAFGATQDHYDTGKYASGLVGGVYAPGSTVYLTMQITAHHYGFHQFVLYDVDDTQAWNTGVNTNTVPSYLLNVTNPDLAQTKCSFHTVNPRTDWCMSGGPQNGNSQTFYMEFDLPKDVVCKKCVLQWHWTTGNSPGANPEEFWNCMDISIQADGPYLNNDRVQPPSASGGYAPNQPDPDTPTPRPPPPPPNSGVSCIALAGSGADDKWCNDVGCDPTYVNAGYCKWQTNSSSSGADTTVSGGGNGASTGQQQPATSCVAVAGKGVTDTWCNQVKCDSTYVNAGFCRLGTPPASGGASSSSTSSSPSQPTTSSQNPNFNTSDANTSGARIVGVLLVLAVVALSF
eukprot:TRINITY_DN1435_c0_g1_i2.p1 TRINITY_DN1435_c0_g1~~TRINITY_DN1435_c0_g1_i2.p1  ORF type:complete len:434 (+),score=80.89 TRINITY_DN1435_c0_g1_i2:58-1359(+)